MTYNKAWIIFGRSLKYLFLAGLAFIILIIILLASASADLKAAASSGLAGKQKVDAVVGALQRQDWLVAGSEAARAREDFNSALKQLSQARENLVIKYFPPVRRQIDDLEYLLKTGEILSRSIAGGIPLVQGLDEIRSGQAGKNFSELAPKQKEAFIRYVFESEPELQGLRANLELSILNLERIHRLGVLFPIYNDINELKEQLSQAAKLLEKSSPLIKLLPALSGYPQASRFLIIMQNNDELRPAGGFIGVYGLMEVAGGEIRSLETHDSYHVDMPASISASWQQAPPEVLTKYLEVEKWYLRDANWFPDWPQSALNVEKIYNGVTGAAGQPAQSFTGIIAITPDLVADLIDLVGPISVRGETYTPENFQPLLQYNVEVAYREQDISQWDRKDIVDELLAELKKRLFELPSDKWSRLIGILDQAVLERDIQLYFQNQNWQTYAKELGASGEVKQVASDYLMAVDANLGAFKSDAVVKKSINYSISEGQDSLEATVKLDYRHEGGFDWRTTRYRSYTRLYAPLGSKLVSISGIQEDTQDRNVSADKSISKTVFGFFFTVEPGSSREVIVKYQLPKYIYDQWQAGDYTLLVQKQAGRRTESLQVGFYPDRGKSGEWTSDLSSDKTFWFKPR